jgi:hypothetical protein
MPEPTDHELLLLLRRDVEQLGQRLEEALTQLNRGNTRFEQIALTEQEVRIAMTALRGDYSRAMLAADEARRSVALVKDELDAWKQRLKTLAWMGAPFFALLSALALDAIRHVIFP